MEPDVIFKTIGINQVTGTTVISGNTVVIEVLDFKTNYIVFHLKQSAKSINTMRTILTSSQ